MTCGICKRGGTRPGTATVTLERDGTTPVVKGIPARVCATCGEAYVVTRDPRMLGRELRHWFGAQAMSTAWAPSRLGCLTAPRCQGDHPGPNMIMRKAMIIFGRDDHLWPG